MNKTMYEVNWHYTNDVLSHCSVTPIKVIRESVLPGCTGVSITAEDSNGRKFQGSPDNYYATEEAAWAAVRVELAESVEAHERQLAELQEQLDAQLDYLAKLTPNAKLSGGALVPSKEERSDD